MDWLKQYWPELLAVLAVIVDEAVKQADIFASSHEHTSVIAVLILVLLRRAQSWLGGQSTNGGATPGTKQGPYTGGNR